MEAWRKWTRDGFRHQRELIPAAEYLRMSYCEKWIGGQKGQSTNLPPRCFKLFVGSEGTLGDRVDPTAVSETALLVNNAS